MCVHDATSACKIQQAEKGTFVFSKSSAWMYNVNFDWLQLSMPCCYPNVTALSLDTPIWWMVMFMDLIHPWTSRFCSFPMPNRSNVWKIIGPSSFCTCLKANLCKQVKKEDRCIGVASFGYTLEELEMVKACIFANVHDHRYADGTKTLRCIYFCHILAFLSILFTNDCNL